jgi:hypothetical protein
LQIKTKNISCHTANSKPGEQEVNSTVILPPLVFPGLSLATTGAEPDYDETSCETFFIFQLDIFQDLFKILMK